MILQLALTNQSLADCLHRLGYETEMRDIPEAVSISHNITEIQYFSRLHVMIDGEWKSAEKFFEKLLDESLLYMIESYTAQIKLNLNYTITE